jgi:hypothetical protein
MVVTIILEWLFVIWVQMCKNDPHPHPFMVWLLNKHWRVLFIVHICIIIVSLKINQIPTNLINKLQVQIKISSS